MIQKTSSLSTLSPLRSRPAPARASAEAPVQDRVELSSAEVPESKGKGWRKWALAAGLGLSVAGSAAAMIGPLQAAVQQVLNPNSMPNLSLTEQLQYQGYAGEAATDRSGVMESIQNDWDRFGGEDNRFGISDLSRVARDEQAPEESRAAAQALLADPTLLNALDVAQGGKVDHIVSQGDLEQALHNEQGGDFGSFDAMRSRLERQTDGSSAFDYYAELSGNHDRIEWTALQQASTSESTPAPYQELAQDLLANPNYFNAFDVASASNYTDWYTNLSSSQSRDGVVSAEDLQNIAYAPLPESGRQFSDADFQALDRLIAGDGRIDSDLFSSFRQTNRGNCASTAVIKAALDRYGDNLFENVSKQPDGNYLVTMQDGFQLQISPSELEAAATATHYAGATSETKSLATLSYASMAKRAWMVGHEGAQTYGQALFSLNNGEVTTRVPGYLGLGDKVQKIDRDQVPDADGAVVFGNGHAYFVDRVDGQVMGDKWGTATPWQGRTTVDQGELQNGALLLLP